MTCLFLYRAFYSEVSAAVVDPKRLVRGRPMRINISELKNRFGPLGLIFSINVGPPLSNLLN